MVARVANAGRVYIGASVYKISEALAPPLALVAVFDGAFAKQFCLTPGPMWSKPPTPPRPCGNLPASVERFDCKTPRD